MTTGTTSRTGAFLLLLTVFTGCVSVHKYPVTPSVKNYRWVAVTGGSTNTVAVLTEDELRTFERITGKHGGSTR